MVHSEEAFRRVAERRTQDETIRNSLKDETGHFVCLHNLLHRIWEHRIRVVEDALTDMDLIVTMIGRSVSEGDHQLRLSIKDLRRGTSNALAGLQAQLVPSEEAPLQMPPTMAVTTSTTSFLVEQPVVPTSPRAVERPGKIRRVKRSEKYVSDQVLRLAVRVDEWEKTGLRRIRFIQSNLLEQIYANENVSQRTGIMNTYIRDHAEFVATQLGNVALAEHSVHRLDDLDRRLLSHEHLVQEQLEQFEHIYC